MPATPLAATWSQVTALIESGYSLIPVRDKMEGSRPAKSPYTGWKKYQECIMPPAELWELMVNRFDTTAIAVICGRVSGNLEVIDLDIKWKPGIDALLFNDIKNLYPSLWEKLRLHRSPSGGFHILYRIIDQPPPGNQKLAKRLTTDAERGNGITKSKEVTFFETRGEGGYVLMPPSLGYTIYKSNPIPLLTWTERCSLISLCESYNEILKVEKEHKVSSKENDYYDENPFEHFNKSIDGRNVLLEFGWTPNKESNAFAWFTKPGSKSGERHASYIKDKQLFYFWSTNTEFDSGKCYTPSTILAQLLHNGDYKQTYKTLVARGFGRIKAGKEARLVKVAKALPANASHGAQMEFGKRLEAMQQAHPFGTFWEIAVEGDRAVIDRESIYRVSGGLGFYLYKQDIVQLVEPGFLVKVDTRTYYDAVKSYIKEDDPVLLNIIINTYEHFLQVAGNFTITRLPLLDESKIMTDRPDAAFKFFKNSWIKITGSGVEEFQYDELPGYVWSERIMDREFIVEKNVGKYYDFLQRAVDFEKMRDHILKVIGFLAHEYKDETTAYIIVLTEQCPDPKMGGGSGKNLFCNLFKHFTTITTRPGEQIKYDEKFFQTWNGERIFVVSDAPKDFNFMFLKELTSGSAVLKKLWKDEMEVTVENLPKIIVNTNYSYEIVDGGLKRRIIPIEFTDFFTRNNGVRHWYKAHFPRDWTDEDWAGYNHIMIEGIQAWINSNLILETPTLSGGGWRKQFEQTYGHYATEFIYEHWDEWVKQEMITNVDFKKQVQEYFEEAGIGKTYIPSIFRLNKAIADYAIHMGVEFGCDVTKRNNGILFKCKTFGGAKAADISIPEPDDELPF